MSYNESNVEKCIYLYWLSPDTTVEVMFAQENFDKECGSTEYKESAEIIEFSMQTAI